jgi:hypothetical protein
VVGVMPKMTNKQVSISNRTNVKDFKGSDFRGLVIFGNEKLVEGTILMITANNQPFNAL